MIRWAISLWFNVRNGYLHFTCCYDRILIDGIVRMLRRWLTAASLMWWLCFAAGCSGSPSDHGANGSPASQTRVVGVPAFAPVSETLYRGGQPTAEGFAELKKMGVGTVVSLRFLQSDRDELSGTGLRYIHMRFNPVHPEEEDVLAFLRVVADPANQPVFIHCRQGVDRTGMMVAVYRMVIQNWSKAEALAEMKTMGFNDRWDAMEDYVTQLNVPRVKTRLASTRPPAVDVVH